MHRNEHEGTLHGPTRFVLVALTLAGLVTATACGGAEAPAPEPEPAAEEPAAEEPKSGTGRQHAGSSAAENRTSLGQTGKAARVWIRGLAYGCLWLSAMWVRRLL